MITQRLKIERYGWTLHVFYAVHSYFVCEIMDELRAIDCPDEFLKQAWENLSAGKLNRGLTYSNYGKRESVMVIGLASSPWEYADSIVHELWHFAVHVSMALGLDVEGEEPAYLIGDTMREMFRRAGVLLCECGCGRTSLRQIDKKHGGGWAR